MAEGSGDYNVTALRKSIAVMGVLAETTEPLGVSEISRQAGISKNMTFRILETLEDMGWVQRIQPGPQYMLTLVPFRFFAGTYERVNLLERSMPILKKLHVELEETIYLSVLHGDRALHIQVLQGTKPISVSGKVGGTFELHCTAQGKVLLAGVAPEKRAGLIKGVLKKYAPATITDKKKLAAHIDMVGKRGYATNIEEFGPGMLGLAAPVKDGEGRVIAALGVFVPSTNLAPDAVEKVLAAPVCAAADDISALFGRVGKG